MLVFLQRLVLTSWQQRYLHKRADEGQTLITVVLIAVVLIIGVMTAVSSSIANLGFSSSFGNKSEAQLTAFSGLSQATSKMANASSISQLPCSTSGTMSLPATAGSTANYSVSIAYFSDSAYTNPITCNGSGSTFGTGTPAGTPASAILTSTGAAGRTAHVVMQEHVIVKPTPVLLPAFSYAMLSLGTLNLTTGLKVNGSHANANLYGGTVNQCANSSSIDGSVQAASSATSNVTIGNTCTINGNFYVNGSVSIGNSANITGNVYAYGGSVTLKDTATVGGSVYASGGSVDISNSATVGGNVYAYGSSSTPGTIRIKANTSTAVSGSAYATGSISEGNATNVSGSINQDYPGSDMPVLAEPPSQTFPQLDPTVASLTNAGYNVIQLGGSSSLPCSEFTTYASSAYTAVYAPTCDVNLSGSYTFDLGSNTVWVVGGFASGGSLTVGSTSSTSSYDVSVVVPNGTACPSGDLSFNGNVFGSLINVLLYTPCSVSFTGNQSISGQIITGANITTTGTFTLAYNQAAATALPGTLGNPEPTITVTNKAVING